MPSPVKPAYSISATSSGLQPVDVAAVLRGDPSPVNGLLSVSSACSLGRRSRNLVAAEAGADAADMDQLAVAVDAGDQRAECAVGRGPAADHHLVPGAALGLGPGLAPAGAIGRVEPLGDDAFQRHPAGRLQHGIAGRDEMVDVADVGAAPPPTRGLQPRLALATAAAGAGPRPPANSRSKTKNTRSVVLPSESAACRAAKSGAPCVIQRHHLAVDDAVGQVRRPRRRSRETFRTSRAPCGSAASPCPPRCAAACDSRRT